jgi:hypothetical protein
MSPLPRLPAVANPSDRSFDPDRLQVDQFRGNAQEHWALYPAGDGDTMELASLALGLPVAEVYADVLLVPMDSTLHKMRDPTR